MRKIKNQSDNYYILHSHLSKEMSAIQAVRNKNRVNFSVHKIMFLQKRFVSFKSVSRNTETMLLEPGEIDHFESARNDQFMLIRNSQCTSMTN